jgi:ankyrin repeat protein
MDPEPVDLTQQLQAVSLEGKPDLDAELEALYDQLNEARPVANHNGRTTLYAAAAAGRLEEVQQLLAAGADVNARRRDGSTPLHAAMGGHHFAVVAALLEAGASRNAEDSKRSTPLHVAASSGATAVMAALMTPGTDPCAYDAEGNTPLHLACIKGLAKAARLLLEGGTPVNQKRAHWYRFFANGTAQLFRRSDGYTPLHAACERGHLEVVRLLLGAGAGVNLTTKQSWSPLFLASQKGHAHLMDDLLAAGASSSVLDKYGWGPLHAATHRNHPQVVQRLLQHPEVAAAVDPPSMRGITPLYLACDKGYSEVAGLLVAAGANMHRPAMNGWTPFHVAISRKHKELVQQLLVAGGDPGAAGGNGLNDLHAAAAAGNVPTLKARLAAIAAGQGTPMGVNDQAQGMTALHWAVERRHLGCVKVLLAAGADPNTLFGEGAVTDNNKSISGASILHRAVQRGFTAAVSRLATPANLSHVWNGQTPLQLAVATGTKGSVAVARALLAVGARPWVADQNGVTPVTMALTSNNEAVKALLPAMVRGECVLYQQQQQLLQEGGQGQGGHQPDLAAVLECVRALAKWGHPGWAAACISAVMDVLGAPAAGSLVQELLKKCFAAGDEAAAGGITTTQLVGVLHQGWLGALKRTCLMDKTSGRLRRLVVQPLQQLLDMHWTQQRQEEGGAAAGGMQAGGAAGVSAELYSKGAAAAMAGQWGAFVGCLEQLTAGEQHYGGDSSNNLIQAAEAHVRGSWAGVAGLCEALLVAWWEARPQVTDTARAQGAVREAVVAGVEAWHQLQLQQQWAVGDNKRR